MTLLLSIATDNDATVNHFQFVSVHSEQVQNKDVGPPGQALSFSLDLSWQALRTVRPYPVHACMQPSSPSTNPIPPVP